MQIFTIHAVYTTTVHSLISNFFSLLLPEMHYAASRKVAVSSPDEVAVFFSWHNPSSLTMALGSTQPLAEMSTRNILEGKERPAFNSN
jgi:hypothetical protein